MTPPAGKTPSDGTATEPRHHVRAPHPHVPHPNTLVDLSQFNPRMVAVMARVLGSVAFIWFCIVLDLFGLAGVVYQIDQYVTGHLSLFTLLLEVSLLVSQFLAQTVIQLIALPVLQNYQNRQSANDEAKKDADHQALTYVAHRQDDQLASVEIIIDRLSLDTAGGLSDVVAAVNRVGAKLAALPPVVPAAVAAPLEVRSADAGDVGGVPV
jgi:hypothetical protein